MKMVGDAVYSYPGDIVTIGIATWGIVRGKSQLLRTNLQVCWLYFGNIFTSWTTEIGKRLEAVDIQIREVSLFLWFKDDML